MQFAQALMQLARICAALALGSFAADLLNTAPELCRQMRLSIKTWLLQLLLPIALASSSTGGAPPLSCVTPKLPTFPTVDGVNYTAEWSATRTNAATL